MILLTVGTCPLAFDRLIKLVDKAVEADKFDEEIVAQIGYSSYVPKNMKYVKVLNKCEFDQLFEESSAIISHGGMGTISMALDAGKPLMAMARERRNKEHVNDHQVETLEVFEELGHLLVIRTENELHQKIPVFKSFKPSPRITNPAGVAQKISDFIIGMGY